MIIDFYNRGGGGGGYVLPTATDTRLGGVKVGSGLTVQEDGTLSVDGGSGVQIVSDLSAITNPTKGMVAIIPQGTVRHMKGWRWSGVTEDDYGSAQIFDNFNHVYYGGIGFNQGSNKYFNSNFGKVELSQRFNQFVYIDALKALIKTSGITNDSNVEWNVEILFPEDVFNHLTIWDTATQYAEVIESDETLGIYDGDKTYIYRDEELLNINCSGVTIDISNISSDFDSSVVGLSVQWGNPDDIHNNNVNVERKEWQGFYAYWINNVAFVDDNIWRATCWPETSGHITILYKQSGNTLYVKAYPNSMAYNMYYITGETYSAASIQMDGGSNVTITQGWECQDNIVTTNWMEGRAFFGIFNYDALLEIYKLISFGRQYNNNDLHKAEALNTFKVQGRGGFDNTPVYGGGAHFDDNIVLSFVDKDKIFNKITFEKYQDDFNQNYQGAPYCCRFEYEELSPLVPYDVCQKINIDVDSAGTETLYLNGLSPEYAYDYAHQMAGYEKATYSKPLYLIAGDAGESWYTDSIEEMKVYRNQAQAEAARQDIDGAMTRAVTIEGKFYNYVTNKWRKFTLATVHQNSTWDWGTPVFSDVDTINIDDIPSNELWYRSDNGQIKNLYLDDWTTHPAVVSNGYYTKKDLGKIVFATPLAELGAAACYAIGIKGVIIPDYITQLGVSCFAINPLTAITLPDTITNIPFDCFSQCRQLTEVHLGSGTTQLEETAFAYCESLSSLTIPASVTTFGDNLFLDCTALSDIYYQSTMSDWGNISKGTDWNSGCPTITVHCTDGDITI